MEPGYYVVQISQCDKCSLHDGYCPKCDGTDEVVSYVPLEKALADMGYVLQKKQQGGVLRDGFCTNCLNSEIELNTDDMDTPCHVCQGKENE